MHHLSCVCNQRKRTLRHTSIKNIVAFNLQKVFHNVRVETLVAVGCQADVQCVMGAGRLETIEISVTSVRPRKNKITWPSHQDVWDGLAEGRAAGPPLQGPLFFWNDHSKETPHPDVLYHRKRRQLCVAASVGQSIGYVTANKKIHYAKAGYFDMRPFVLTAGGGMGGPANDLVNDLTTAYTKDIRDQSSYHRGLMGRMSVVMLKHSYSMAQACLKLQMERPWDNESQDYPVD